MRIATLKPISHHERFLPAAEKSGRQLIASWIEYGPKQVNELDPELMPTGPLVSVAGGVLDAMVNEKVSDFAGLLAYFADAPTGVSAELGECYQSMPPRPENCGPLIENLVQYDVTRKREHLAHQLQQTLERGDDPASVLGEIAALEASGDPRKTSSIIVPGVNSYPTETPPEDVILGNGWGRKGDILNLISTAGAGKSVAAIQAGMAWGIGLPYLGILPARPLRILLFSGEDDGVTIGQCREGFLDHSEAITGRQLSSADLEPLDGMLRTEFSREHVGIRFHAHLDRLLNESPVDLVIINPLLSYVGGEIVACASEWLRAGLMPILQKHSCAALIAHHTGKMAKDGWDNTDDTYSAIGGGEMANIPRSIITLRPTAAEGLSVLKVSKRQTTGWTDANGDFTTSFFIRRTNDPTRPAWLPVDSDEAQEILGESKAAGSSGKGGKKATAAHVVKALETGAMQRQQLIQWLMRECKCSDKPARDAITDAEADDLVETFNEPNPRGGNPLKWFCLPEHKNQWVK